VRVHYVTHILYRALGLLTCTRYSTVVTASVATPRLSGIRMQFIIRANTSTYVSLLYLSFQFSLKHWLS